MDYAKTVYDKNKQAEASMCYLPGNPHFAGESSFSDTSSSKSNWHSDSSSRQPENASSPPTPFRRGRQQKDITPPARNLGGAAAAGGSAAPCRAGRPRSAAAGQLRSPRIGHLPRQSFHVASPAGRDRRGERTVRGSRAGHKPSGGGWGRARPSLGGGGGGGRE